MTLMDMQSDSDTRHKENIPSDENEDIKTMPKIINNQKPCQWHDFVDDEDDD